MNTDQRPDDPKRKGRRGAPARLRARLLLFTAALAGGIWLVSARAQDGASGAGNSAVLEQARLSMGKWIETQQILSKEQNDWQQGREILAGRLELLRKEVATTEEQIQQAEANVAAANKKRDELELEEGQVRALTDELTRAVTAMEAEVRRLLPTLPEPVRPRIEPLVSRMPEDAATTRVRVAERYQNVLGILNEINKANLEINVSYEVHTLGGGQPSEVKAIYVGLGQAYYVSANGEAGIGRPSPEGWKWEPSNAVAADVLVALEILQNKRSPAFVPLPVKLQ